MVNPMDLGGRFVLVTGASSGIGRDTAVLLSELGARIALVARNQARLAETLASLSGEGHRAEVFDLSMVDRIPSWLKSLTAQTGPLDGMVHSAGVHHPAPLRILDSKKLESVIRIDIEAAVMLAKGFRQGGCHRESASLVFLSSAAALAGQPGIAAYSATKAALLGLARSLAMELAAEGIRVNCVAPGMVKSETTNKFLRGLSSEAAAAIEAKHPLGFGSVRDVSYAVAFLLGEASRWITGSTLVVDGGFTAH
jgi:NAD(P)-dependent dehydrogenase (short-subunit alcohol dehydrogenase family)